MIVDVYKYPKKNGDKPVFSFEVKSNREYLSKLRKYEKKYPAK